MRHFLDIEDFSSDQLREILDIARRIKKDPKAYQAALNGKVLGLIFEKPSTRTRISFAVGMSQMGGTSLYLSPREIQLGQREEIRDVARTMSRFLNVVVMRTFRHQTLTEFAQYASIPIINGLTDYSHPCQAVADYLTVTEKFKDPASVRLAYVGDGNNVLLSLVTLFSRLGLSISFASPKGYELDPALVDRAQGYARQSGADVKPCKTPEEAVRDADVVYADVFISMGEEGEKEEKIKAFSRFQVNQALLAHCRKKPLIMHCLPAHRGEEITDEVIESDRSIVFDQAENRLHAQKGILYWLLNQGSDAN